MALCINIYILLAFSTFKVLWGAKSCDSTACPNERPLCTPVGCVALCPENSFEKDGACVLTCEDGVVVDNKCRNECPADRNFTVNEVVVRGERFHNIRFCYKSCGSLRFFYNNTCVISCPQNAKFSENQQCTPNCSNSHPFRLEKLVSFNRTFIKCVNQCPFQKRILRNQTCVSKCEDNEVVFRGMCTKCTNSSYFIYRDACITECPRETFYYNNTCTKDCPSKAFNGSCVTECPKSLFINNYLRVPTCVEKCPEGMFIKNFTCEYCQELFSYNNTCVETCPFEMPFSFDSSTHFFRTNPCLKQCPYFSYTMNFTCMASCRGLKVYNKTCVETCPLKLPFSNQFYHSEIHCVKKCPENKYTMNFTCMVRCPSNSKVYKRTCVETCPSDMPFSSDENHHRGNPCLGQCPENKYTMNFTCKECNGHLKPYNKTCVEECPLTSPFSFGNTSSDNSCLKLCPENLFTMNFTCMTSCPPKFKVYNKTCDKTCPSTLPFSFDHDNHENSCLKQCPEKSFSMNFTCKENCPWNSKVYNRTCVKTCPSTLPFSFIGVKPCLKQCPNDSYAMNYTCLHNGESCPGVVHKNVCMESCPETQFQEYRRCVNECTEHMYYDGNGCVFKCPEKRFIDEKKCVGICPDDKPFAEKNRSCVKRCSGGQLSKGYACIERSECVEPIIYDTVCSDTCPDGMYWIGYSVSGGGCLSMWILYGVIFGSVLLMVVLHLACAKFFRLQPFSCGIVLWKRFVKLPIWRRRQVIDYQLIPVDEPKIGAEDNV